VDLVDSFDARSTYYFKILVIDPIFLDTKGSLNDSSMKINKKMKFSYFSKGMQIDQIKIGITEITRNGNATVNVFSNDNNNDGSLILKQISNKTMELSVLSEGIPQYKVPYEIVSKSINASSLKLLIRYPNPLNVSIS
jgi:hypothetical protein